MDLTTITVSVETKKMLERLKGDLSWDEFLRHIAVEYSRIVRSKYARRYLKERKLDDDEAEFILKSIEEGRKHWVSRE